MRGPPPAPPPPPPKTFEQKGSFTTIVGQESVVFFPVPYASPPRELTSGYRDAVVITECTAKSFKWRNVAKARPGNEGDVSWTATGVLAAPGGK